MQHENKGTYFSESLNNRRVQEKQSQKKTNPHLFPVQDFSLNHLRIGKGFLKCFKYLKRSALFYFNKNSASSFGYYQERRHYPPLSSFSCKQNWSCPLNSSTKLLTEFAKDLCFLKISTRDSSAGQCPRNCQ